MEWKDNILGNVVVAEQKKKKNLTDQSVVL